MPLAPLSPSWLQTTLAHFPTIRTDVERSFRATVDCINNIVQVFEKQRDDERMIFQADDDKLHIDKPLSSDKPSYFSFEESLEFLMDILSTLTSVLFFSKPGSKSARQQTLSSGDIFGEEGASLTTATAFYPSLLPSPLFSSFLSADPLPSIIRAMSVLYEILSFRNILEPNLFNALPPLHPRSSSSSSSYASSTRITTFSSFSLGGNKNTKN